MAVSIDHIKITVTNFNRSKLFYSKLFTFFKLKKIFKAGEKSAWHGKIVMFGTKDWTFEIQAGRKKVKFDRRRTGLDHIAFSAPSKKSVDDLYLFLKKNKFQAFKPREYPEYCKGYYACFFLDPDEIILEYVYCPVPNE